MFDFFDPLRLTEEQQLEAASRHLKSVQSRADADKSHGRSRFFPKEIGVFWGYPPPTNSEIIYNLFIFMKGPL